VFSPPARTHSKRRAWATYLSRGTVAVRAPIQRVRLRAMAMRHSVWQPTKALGRLVLRVLLLLLLLLLLLF